MLTIWVHPLNFQISSSVKTIEIVFVCCPALMFYLIRYALRNDLISKMLQILFAIYILFTFSAMKHGKECGTTHHEKICTLKLMKLVQTFGDKEDNIRIEWCVLCTSYTTLWILMALNSYALYECYSKLLPSLKRYIHN